MRAVRVTHARSRASSNSATQMLARRLQRSALPRLLARRAPLCSAASPISASTSAAAASGSAASADAPVPADAVDLRLATGPAPTRFAVLELGGTQYKVAPDDAICVEKLPVAVGEVVAYDRVLLVGSADATVIGSPYVRDAVVEVRVEEQALADKVIVFKKKRRKGYRRWKGHRAPLTVLRVASIGCPELDAIERGEEPPGSEAGGYPASPSVKPSRYGAVFGPREGVE